MSNLTHGMNVEEVRALGNDLQRRKGQIEEIISQIESQVSSAGWQGQDADTFRNDWWPQHKAALQNIGEQLHGFGQSALNNASEQVDVSGR